MSVLNSGMKTLLGLLTVLAFGAAGFAGASALVLLYGGGIVSSWEASSTVPSASGGLLLAAIGMATIIGLASAIVAGLGGLLLTFLHFLCKRWIFMVISALVCVAGSGLWVFFVTTRH
jgi:hypothetical protein